MSEGTPPSSTLITVETRPTDILTTDNVGSRTDTHKKKQCVQCIVTHCTHIPIYVFYYMVGAIAYWPLCGATADRVSYCGLIIVDISIDIIWSSKM